MKLISFDIGIKNMAFCIFDISPGSHNVSIQEWNVLNLMEEETPKTVCNYITIPKGKKSLPKECCKVAKYKKFDKYFCDKHSKNSPDYIIPTKECSQSSFKKMKSDELLRTCCLHGLIDSQEETSVRFTKIVLLEKLQKYFEEKCFELIINKKKKTANDTDLIMIGKNMKLLLNKVDGIQDVTHVIIENQISPIANRMKTIQGMLAQYFIMNNENINIEFISSSNKLRSIVGNIPKTVETTNLENTLRTCDEEMITQNQNQNSKYKAHKKDGVALCSQILEKNGDFILWKHVLETKKKDDLADCFLQGIWYLRKKEIM